MKVSFVIFIKVPDQRITKLIKRIYKTYKVYVQAKDELALHVTIAYSKNTIQYEDAIVLKLTK